MLYGIDEKQEGYMHFEEQLRICLFAIESRYIHYSLDINADITDLRAAKATGWRTPDLIAYLEQHAPELLSASALLVVNGQKSEIYLVECSKEQAAFLVHCRGRIPQHQEVIPTGATLV